mmetsp:Transcript_14521/g.33199  ORF Transcript_14521/g.33199 Transcript_14521/m.33199 type:complete len:286 (-) Transcript_14521:179-1036(-)
MCRIMPHIHAYTSHNTELSVARPMLCTPSFSPLIVWRRPTNNRLHWREHARDPRHVVRHGPRPNVDGHSPWPEPPLRRLHHLRVGGVAEVRILGHQAVILLVFEPALALRVHMDVKREATFLRAEGPNRAGRLLLLADDIRPPRPPAHASSIRARAGGGMQLACTAAFRGIAQLEPHAPHQRTVSRISCMLARVAGGVIHLRQTDVRALRSAVFGACICACIRSLYICDIERHRGYGGKLWKSRRWSCTRSFQPLPCPGRLERVQQEQQHDCEKSKLCCPTYAKP